MPRIMTMNGDHQSVAAAPLDLRTTHRERGTPGCTERVRDARTGADSLEKNGASSPGSHGGASRKRLLDSSSLPLRKRPFPVEPESRSQSPVPAPSTERFPPAEDAGGTGHQGAFGPPADAGWILPASAAPRRPEKAAAFSIQYFVPSYPMYRLHPVPEFFHPLTHHTKNPLASDLATRQDEDGDTALHIAVVKGELDIVRKLIQILHSALRSPDIFNNLRQTPLHLAVITQHERIVEELLRGGADPAALDRNGQTAMHLCCEYNQLGCLSVVLSQPSSSACLEIRNFEGLSPLHLAVLRGHIDLAKMLLDAGADINATDIKSGQSPLMHAVECNNPDMVHFLIENGCDVNSQSYSGNTPLHNACGRGQVDTVRLLLKSGADSTLKNYHNDTPMMVAKNKKITDVLRGRVSSQIRLQDQYSVSISPRERNFPENGSPSPSHSSGCSLHYRSSHSPKTLPSPVFPFY
ncbi:B-cell lymphoma 3 protein [Nelusetta ayraudi]|uniref:B-cell lymphoma 3 protein n=1 Tax=Nelusetta ayraudi TaxID=303726 RepID=UPI003F6FE960